MPLFHTNALTAVRGDVSRQGRAGVNLPKRTMCDVGLIGWLGGRAAHCKEGSAESVPMLIIANPHVMFLNP